MITFTPTFITSISDILSWLLATLVGGFVTYYYSNRQQRKQTVNDINAAANVIGFFIALQISELTSLQENIKERVQKITSPDYDILKNPKEIIQDFVLCEKIGIDMENLASKILAHADKKVEQKSKTQEDITQILQRVFISDKAYFKIIGQLKNFHEMKKQAPKDLTGVNAVLYFAEQNMPVYKQEITNAIAYEKETLDLFKEKIFKHFKLTVHVELGPIYQIPAASL